MASLYPLILLKLLADIWQQRGYRRLRSFWVSGWAPAGFLVEPTGMIMRQWGKLYANRDASFWLLAFGSPRSQTRDPSTGSGQALGEPEFDRVTTHQGQVLVPLLAVIG